MERKAEFLEALQKIKRLKGNERRWFIAGFVDGEGSFNIAFAHHPIAGIILNAQFQVYQHKDCEEILWLIKEELRCGRMDKKWGTDVRVLTVDGRQNLLEKVVPFFKKYVAPTKQRPFRIFVDTLERMERGEHKTLRGFLQIVENIYDMNQNGKSRQISKEKLIQEIKQKFSQLKNPQRPNAEL